MSKTEILELLRDLLEDATVTTYDPDDISGGLTTYTVDHETLMANIETQLKREQERNGNYGDDE